MPPLCFDFSKFPTESPLLLPPIILYKLSAYTSFQPSYATDEGLASNRLDIIERDAHWSRYMLRGFNELINSQIRLTGSMIA